MKNFKITIIAFLSIVTFATSQTKKITAKAPVRTTTSKPRAVTTTYPSVIIGDQEWMSKNLDVSTFRNGDPIPQAKTNDEWKSACENKKPAWCYYVVGYSKQKIFGIPEKTKKYGKLYNWFAFNSSKILAPKGWHNPSTEEWNKLFANYSYEYNSYYKDYEIDYKSPQLVKALKSETGWDEFNGNNSSGFNVLPAGYRFPNEYNRIGEDANFWTYSPEVYGNGQKSGNILLKTINFSGNGIYIHDGDFTVGYSVRCVKDIVVAPVVQENTTSPQSDAVKLRSAKQILPLLMNDLSQVSSYKNGITGLGYHTTGNNDAGGFIYTSSDNDWIIYNAPFKNNDTTVFGLIYYSKEIDNLNTVLSYLDGYSDNNLYYGFPLETIESKNTKFNLSENKSAILNSLVNGSDIYIDNSKYYIQKRNTKNSLFRGIRLVNKTENGIVKSYFTAIVYVQQEVSNRLNTNQERQEGLSDEYKESEFHGQEEIQYNLPPK